MKKTSFFLITLASFYLSSCQKELSEEDGLLPGQTSSPDSNWLSKMYYIDTTVSASDTIRIILFAYDNVHRVTTQVDSADNLNYSVIKYSYLSNALWPFKSVLYNYNPLGNDTVYNYHFYDVNGKKTRDSTIINASSVNYETDVCHYSYSANKIMGISFQREASYPDNFNSYKDSATLDAGGNILLLSEYMYDAGALQYNLQFVISTTMDNKPDPVAKLSSHFAHPVFPAGNDPTEFIEYPQKNNFTSFTVDHYNNGVIDLTETFPFQYVYNSFGYAKEMLPGGVAGKVSFIYTVF